VALIPIVELAVSEAYALLTARFGVTNVPPLEAIENEDWGRDYVLTRLSEIPASVLAEAGLCSGRCDSGTAEDWRGT
jgi:hypothetical protein